MSEEDQKIKDYYALKPLQFDILVKIELEQLTPPEASPPELNLEIVLRPGDDADNRRLRLSFFGVNELVLRQPPLSLFGFPHIEINSIRENQWEGLSYSVTCEEDAISFVCKSFDVTVQPT